MATGTLAPAPWFTVENASGVPYVGAKVNTYLAGTTTPVATYTDSGLTVANANPIVTDSAGRYVAYLSPGASYKFVITDANGVAIRTQDNISAVPASASNLDITGTAGEALTAGLAVYLSDGSGSKTAGQWFKADSANTYSSTLPEVGMTTAAISSGSSGTIRLGGQATGLSAVVVGTSYYVGTSGALTSTPPTNRRFLGQADSTSSVILSANPPITGLTVLQGGTGAATLTAHGVLLGQGTSAIVATSAGTAGQVLVSGGASADPAFATGPWALLRANSGTDTTAAAADVDAFTVTGLTALDSLRVVFVIESVTQQTANVIIRTATDSVSLGSLTNALAVAAGVQVMGELILKSRQGSTTNLMSRTSAMNSVPADLSITTLATVVTAWTGTWSMALRHGGVTAGGTFKWSWAVYRMQGQ